MVETTQTKIPQLYQRGAGGLSILKEQGCGGWLRLMAINGARSRVSLMAGPMHVPATQAKCLLVASYIARQLPVRCSKAEARYQGACIRRALTGTISPSLQRLQLPYHATSLSDYVEATANHVFWKLLNPGTEVAYTLHDPVGCMRRSGSTDGC